MHVPEKILERMAPASERRRVNVILQPPVLGIGEILLLLAAAVSGVGWIVLPWVCIWKLLF